MCVRTILLLMLLLTPILSYANEKSELQCKLKNVALTEEVMKLQVLVLQYQERDRLALKEELERQLKELEKVPEEEEK